MALDAYENFVLWRLVHGSAVAATVAGIWVAGSHLGGDGGASAAANAQSRLVDRIETVRDRLALCDVGGSYASHSHQRGDCHFEARRDLEAAIRAYMLSKAGTTTPDARVRYDVDLHNSLDKATLTVTVDDFDRTADSAMIDGLRQAFMRGRLAIDEEERVAEFTVSVPLAR